nr:hypothetical protein [Vibrio harveyi]
MVFKVVCGDIGITLLTP